ncbi:MAG TPA: hypothetical protein VEN99_05415, partial [Acidimicrobiia bacterium]|nr:hypothetical protein [Acidimicrobiia bacterium]
MSVGEPATPAAADVPEDGRETAAGPRPGPGDDAPRGDIEGGDIESGDVEGGGDEDSEPPLPPIPDALLGPLFDSAGEALRRLPPVELPPAARPLRAFDRRGLATPTARHQLRRLLDGDEGILAAARTLLLARAEAARLATAWREAVAAGGDACLDLVSDTAAEGRLPLLASVLTAALPDGVEFGLGLVVAMAAAGERETEGANAVRAAVAGQASAEEAHRRADAARSSAEAEVARLETALKEERRARRAREQEADETTAGTEARRAELEKALVEAGKELTAAQRRLLAAERRVADAEQRAVDAEQRAA